MTADTAPFAIRHMDRTTRDRISRAARTRNMTLAQYLTALIDLHDACRELADGPHDPTITRILTALDLETVTA